MSFGRILRYNQNLLFSWTIPRPYAPLNSILSFTDRVLSIDSLLSFLYRRPTLALRALFLTRRVSLSPLYSLYSLLYYLHLSSLNLTRFYLTDHIITYTI